MPRAAFCQISRLCFPDVRVAVNTRCVHAVPIVTGESMSSEWNENIGALLRMPSTTRVSPLVDVPQSKNSSAVADGVMPCLRTQTSMLHEAPLNGTAAVDTKPVLVSGAMYPSLKVLPAH